MQSTLLSKECVSLEYLGIGYTPAVVYNRCAQFQLADEPIARDAGAALERIAVQRDVVSDQLAVEAAEHIPIELFYRGVRISASHSRADPRNAKIRGEALTDAKHRARQRVVAQVADADGDVGQEIGLHCAEIAELHAPDAFSGQLDYGLVLDLLAAPGVGVRADQASLQAQDVTRVVMVLQQRDPGQEHAGVGFVADRIGFESTKRRKNELADLERDALAAVAPQRMADLLDERGQVAFAAGVTAAQAIDVITVCRDGGADGSILVLQCVDGGMVLRQFVCAGF